MMTKDEANFGDDTFALLTRDAEGAIVAARLYDHRRRGVDRDHPCALVGTWCADGWAPLIDPKTGYACGAGPR